MNYRHSFHAGNFADILKHLVLMRILAYLGTKEAPFRVIDTHAGAGFYNLKGNEASRTGEWHGGIARLRKKKFSPESEAILAPFRSAIAALAPDETSYPGSPLLIQYAMRAQDKASFNELHAETFQLLRESAGRDSRLILNPLDAYLAWKAQIPPPERRGLVLVDPPFEEPGEFARMAEGLAIMGKKWPTGIAALWYPIKDRRAVDAFEIAVQNSGFTKLLVLELHIDDIATTGPLGACGLLIANPPWTLADDMTRLLPDLSKCLARNTLARWRVEWLAKS